MNVHVGRLSTPGEKRGLREPEPKSKIVRPEVLLPLECLHSGPPDVGPITCVTSIRRHRLENTYRKCCRAVHVNV
jgi:hypothetical protein